MDRLILILTALTAAGGCSASSPAPTTNAPAPRDTVVVVDSVRSAPGVDPATEARMARLEIMLLERDARIGELQRTLELTRQEVVRNLAKLQSQASRAEAASGLAEAEIAVQTLGRVPGGRALAEYGEAEALVEEGSREFGRDNFGGALYLATQARTLAAGGRTRLAARAGDDLEPGETVFSTPVPLRTVDERVNVRSGPGLTFAVIATLDPGTAVVGQSYTDEWVRVQEQAGREGWIFHTLVAAPNR